MSIYSKQINTVVHNRLIPDIAKLAVDIAAVEPYSYSGEPITSYRRKLTYSNLLFDFLTEYIDGDEEMDNYKLVNIVNLLGMPDFELGSVVPTITKPIVPISPCAVFLIDNDRNIYSYDPVTNKLTLRLSYTEYAVSVDIASSDTKLWIVNSSTSSFIEYNITLGQFSIEYNRPIKFNTFPGSGLGSNNNTTLIGSSNNNIILYNITGNVASETVLFSMGTGRYVTGDIIYNPISDTYIISNHILIPSLTYYITEFASDGTIINELDITNICTIDQTEPYGIFQSENVLYSILVNSTTSYVYSITNQSLTLVDTKDNFVVYGASQNVTCITENIPLQTNPTILTLTAQGTGLGVGKLSITTTAPITITLDGVAKFYSNAAGTLDESSSWTTGTGDVVLYIRCASGSSNMTFTDKLNVSRFGTVTSYDTSLSCWLYVDSFQYSNTPTLTLDNFDFPNCTEIAVSGGALTIFNHDLSNLPSALQKIIASGTGLIVGDIANIPVSVTICTIGQPNYVYGDIANLPSNLLKFALFGSNTVTGDIANLPSTLLEFYLTGSSTIYGDVANLPSVIQKFYVQGNNTINGDVGGFPSTLIFISVSGQNTLSGDIAGIVDTATEITIQGNNTISGDLANVPTQCLTLTIWGNNTLTGGFAALNDNMTYLSIYGNCTINGDLSDLPSHLTSLTLSGTGIVTGIIADFPASLRSISISSNTISGVISDFKSVVQWIYISGANTISGNIGNLPTACYYCLIQGNNTISDYTSKSWNINNYFLSIIPTGAGGLSSSEIDQLLIDINASSFTGYYKTINLTGTNASPTATSAAARSSLISKGVTLTTN